MEFKYFSKKNVSPKILDQVSKIFEAKFDLISSFNDDNNEERRKSDDVLKILQTDLENVGFRVEKSKKRKDKIIFNHQFNDESIIFEVDAYHPMYKVAIEVEAGRAWDNKQFLKDIFEAAIIKDIHFLVVAVRLNYRGRNDFEKIYRWLYPMYKSDAISLNFKGLLLIGY